MGDRCCLCNVRTEGMRVCQKCLNKISCNPSTVVTLINICANIIQGIECETSLEEAFLNFRSTINPPPLKFVQPEFTLIDVSVSEANGRSGSSVLAQSDTLICDCGASITLLITKNKECIQATLKCVLWQCDGCEQFFLRKEGRLYKAKGISAVT